MKIKKFLEFIEGCVGLFFVYLVGVILTPVILIEFLLMEVILDDD
jgi:hypothetical protein